MQWVEEQIRKDVCRLNSKLAFTTNTQIESSWTNGDQALHLHPLTKNSNKVALAPLPSPKARCLINLNRGTPYIFYSSSGTRVFDLKYDILHDLRTSTLFNDKL